MNPSKTIGLGEPEPIGKKSLFQPPEIKPKAEKTETPSTPKADIRIRITTEIKKESLAIIQEHRNQYRLETGHALPMRKIIDEAMLLYDRAKKGEEHEKEHPSNPNQQH